MNYLHQTSFGIGMLGVLVIVFGVICGMARFVRAEFLAATGKEIEEERRRLRHVLGYYLLLGLEFLIAADIIDTLMRPTLMDLGALGAIVLIRTVISFSLNAELKSEQQHRPAGNPDLAGTSCRGVSARAERAERIMFDEQFASHHAPLNAARTAVPTESSP